MINQAPTGGGFCARWAREGFGEREIFGRKGLKKGVFGVVIAKNLVLCNNVITKMKKKRSVGVTILGIYFFVAAIMNVPDLPALSFYGKAVTLIGITFYIISGIGVLCLFEWARKLVIYVALAWFIVTFLFYENRLAYHLKFTFPSETPPPPKLIWAHFAVILRAASDAFIIYFFTRPKVKEQFK